MQAWGGVRLHMGDPTTVSNYMKKAGLAGDKPLSVLRKRLAVFNRPKT